jgi:hypothetical protein
MKKETAINSMGRVDLHKPRITSVQGVSVVEKYCIVCGIFHRSITAESCFKKDNKNV